jgi:hypothetical protein
MKPASSPFTQFSNQIVNFYTFESKRDQIGEGAYGVVYKARSNKDPSKYVAIKQMKSTREGVGIPQDAYREIKVRVLTQASAALFTWSAHADSEGAQPREPGQAGRRVHAS